MITINANLSSIASLIARLENSMVSLHQRAIELYPHDEYEKLDAAAVDCGRCLDFFILSRYAKELETGFKQVDLEINYLTARLSQLEQFLYKSVDQHRNDLLSVISAIHNDITDKKYKRHLIVNQITELIIPDDLAIILKKHGFLNLPE